MIRIRCQDGKLGLIGTPEWMDAMLHRQLFVNWLQEHLGEVGQYWFWAGDFDIFIDSRYAEEAAMFKLKFGR